MRSVHLCVFLAAALVGSLSVFAAGDPYKVTASDAAAADQFGLSVGVSGDTAIVGAYLNDGEATGAGAAYIYRWQGDDWAEEQRLFASDAEANDLFGYAVAIDGNTAAVAAVQYDNANTNDGAVYIFTRTGTTWTEQQILTASDGELSDLFGTAVALDGETLVVGVERRNEIGSDSGAAYVFRRTGGVWTQEAKLVSTDLASGDRFGKSVAVSGDTIVVGAHLATDTYTSQGSAYVFTRSGASWTQQDKLTASDPAAGDQYGWSVTVDGDTAAVGAIYDDDVFGLSGSVYVYTRSAGVWTQQQKLNASDPDSNSQFGRSLSLDGDTLLIGAAFDSDTAAGDQGSAYVFTRFGSAWTEASKLVAPDAAASDRFGVAVALDNEVVVIGASHDDDAGGVDQGSAYIFERVGVPWGAPPEKFFNPYIEDASFGSALALDGSRAIVGARTSEVARGRAYVLEESAGSWLTSELIASDRNTSDVFGKAVDLDGLFTVVGAPGDSDLANDAGSAYIFERVAGAWTEQTKLVASDGAAEDEFGHSVGISGDTVVIGAPTYTGPIAPSPSPGAAYVFTNVGGVWTEQAKLEASDGLPDDKFGYAVDIEGDTAVVGAWSDEGPAGVEQGAAYIFVRVGGVWSEQAKLTASDAGEGDFFGAAVAISGDTVIVGAYGGNAGGIPESGAAYIYTRSGSTWTEQARLVAPDGAFYDHFGESVAIHVDTAVVGAEDDTYVGGGAGSAYVFERSGGAWAHRAKLADDNLSEYDSFGDAVAVHNRDVLVGVPGYMAYEKIPGKAHLFVLDSGVEDEPGTFAIAVGAAADGDAIRRHYSVFWDEETVDFAGRALAVHCMAEFRQPAGAHWILAGGSALSAQLQRPAFYYGGVSLPHGATVSMDAHGARFAPGGSLTLGHGATLDIASPVVNIEGATEIGVGAALIAEGGLRLRTPINLADALLASGGATTNEVSVNVLADSIVDGDYTNNGVTTIQNGTLTILGTLTDNGTIIGDFATTRSAPGGLFVDEDYNAGAGSSLLLTGGIAKFGANTDIAINDNTRFDMATSEARMVGLAGSPQTYELMSTDIGANPNGLDRTLAGHHPLGAFRVGPTPATVNLVDNHDNDQLGQGAKEALYVSNLIIDAGATLNTNGCTIYYETLTNNGSVDDPGNLIQIAACVADITSDGVVDGADLATLLAQWGTAGTADFTGDNNVDGADLAVLLAAWGSCP